MNACGSCSFFGRKRPVARRVHAVVLNFNQGEATVQAVEELRRSRGVEVDVLAVDSASDPADLAGVRAAIDSDHLLALPRNLGYAGGMNAGLSFWSDVDPEVPVLLVTPDARVGEGVVAELLSALDAHSAAGAAGPVVVYSTEPRRRIGAGGTVHPRRGRIRLLSEVRGREPYEVEWIEGCCMLLRPEAVREIGGFDEEYFLYFEEVDLCHRLRKGGWRVLLVPGASVLHLKEPGGQGAHYFYYMVRNAYRFWRRNFDVPAIRPALESVRATLWLMLVAVGLLLRPNRWDEIPARIRDLRLQVAGAWAGTLDHIRGRYGPRRESRQPPPSD